jgi:hypothetical protein
MVLIVWLIIEKNRYTVHPKTKFKFKFGNQKTLQQTGNLQWISKKPHSNKDPMNEKHAEFKATIFNNFSLRLGINNNVKIPKSEIARYI